jgi:hypothetical protein
MDSYKELRKMETGYLSFRQLQIGHNLTSIVLLAVSTMLVSGSGFLVAEARFHLGASIFDVHTPKQGAMCYANL